MFIAGSFGHDSSVWNRNIYCRLQRCKVSYTCWNIGNGSKAKIPFTIGVTQSNLLHNVFWHRLYTVWKEAKPDSNKLPSCFNYQTERGFAIRVSAACIFIVLMFWTTTFMFDSDIGATFVVACLSPNDTHTMKYGKWWAFASIIGLTNGLSIVLSASLYIWLSLELSLLSLPFADLILFREIMKCLQLSRENNSSDFLSLNMSIKHVKTSLFNYQTMVSLQTNCRNWEVD